MILNVVPRCPKTLEKVKLLCHPSRSTASRSADQAHLNDSLPLASEPEHRLNVIQTSNKLLVEDTPVKTSLQKKNEDGPRINPVGIQMLPSSIFRQLFGSKIASYDEKDVKNALANLKHFGLNPGTAGMAPEVDLKLPPLEGINIEEHFKAIGEQQSGPYRKLLNKLVVPLPEKPSVWELQTGWTRYIPGKPPERVSFPLEDSIVVDVEVCRSVGQMPTLATAASSEAWYGWVSPHLVEGGLPSPFERYTTQHLIPLESHLSQRGVGLGDNLRQPRIAVGHNIMYDRARFKEQYWLERTGMRFMDTMSMHICVSGVTSYQKMLLTKAKKAAEEKNLGVVPSEDMEDMLSLQQNSSLNSLGEVLNLYCGRNIDKSFRDLFIDGQLDEIRRHFQTSMSYCASDVVATHDIFMALYPLFLDRFPHPVTLAGMLEISMAYLPVSGSWDQYLEEAQQTYQDLNVEAKLELARRAEDACSLLHNNAYQKDLWMWDQDWSVSELRLTKRKVKPKSKTAESSNQEEMNDQPHIILAELQNRSKEFNVKPEVDPEIQALLDTGVQLPLKPPHLPGYPAWYRKLCLQPKESDWSPGPQLITTKMQVTPKLLHLTWEKYPLHYIRGEGWGSLHPVDVEKGTNGKTYEMKGAPIGFPLEEFFKYWNSIPDAKRKFGGDVTVCEGVMFSKLPHKNGPGLRVGDPLARDFLVKISENILSGDAVAEKVLDIARKLSYWRNNRDRIMEQVVVWLLPRDKPRTLEDSRIGVILPQLVVCGTLTRRAVERTWMTASNISKERVGSELRAMVQAPAGYSIIGADVDSQELWIASLIGDACATKMHGGTPFGWMTLSGRKAEGTDMHSVTAKAVGISRDHAKIINYARIYGAGTPFAEQLLKQFNPSMSAREAKLKAKKMFEMTKGRRAYGLRRKTNDVLSSGKYSSLEASQIADSFGKRKEDMFKLEWVGGTESAMFNRLEAIAYQDEPKTPFLNGRLSRALEVQKNQNIPTRINWVVQSGAVDFLHLLLVAFRWLEPESRFCLSFHDEVRYLVPDDKAYRAALALHVAHLLTRVFCASRVGLVDLPFSVAFFTSVEVDKTLRKEANDNCQTPSNPHGLEKGYGIPLGECLNIYKAIEKAGGPHALLSATKQVRKRCVKAAQFSVALHEKCLLCLHFMCKSVK